MLKSLLALFLFLHGMIHLPGFVKACRLAPVAGLSGAISETAGLLWLAAAVLFTTTAILLLLKKESWWAAGLTAVVLSQIMVFTAWHDTRFGTIANLLLFLACILAAASRRFENRYKKDVAMAMDCVKATPPVLLTETDISHLPLPVQKYLRYVGVIGHPRVAFYHVVFEGAMRAKGKDWFPFVSTQANFTGVPIRLFFMKGKFFGVTVPGYHAYRNGKASMQVRLFGLWPLVKEEEGLLNKAETVTLFNDMCLLAPATLVDPAIQWTTIDSSSVKAVFTVQENTITATLQFNEKGELVNFVSDDRYDTGQKRTVRFSTPVGAYKDFDGYRLPSYGEAVWHYPDGDFVYGKFYTKAVRYNAREAVCTAGLAERW